MPQLSKYDEEAELYEWNAPAVIFGLNYEYVEPGNKFLDLGVGTGLSSLLFHKAGMQIYGIDVSEEMLKLSGEKGFAADLKQHSLLEAPYPYASDFFDLAVSLAVFNNFPGLDLIFSEVSRIVKPGGIFSFAVEDQKEGQPDKFLYRYQAHPEGIVMHRHSRVYIEKLLAENSFSLLKTVEFLAWIGTDGNDDVYFTIYVLCRD